MDPVFPRIVEMEVHLAVVGVGKFSNLQVDDHETSQAAVGKEQVHPVPFVADAQPLLPADKAEIAAQLQEEGLQVPISASSRRCLEILQTASSPLPLVVLCLPESSEILQTLSPAPPGFIFSLTRHCDRSGHSGSKRQGQRKHAIVFMVPGLPLVPSWRLYRTGIRQP